MYPIRGYIGKHAKIPTQEETWQVGEIRLVSIAEILEYWTSVDFGGCGGNWDNLLREKRRDYQFDNLVESLRKYGFTEPTVCRFNCNTKQYPHYPEYGNGNHRLAAAIKLGLTHIPMILATDIHGFGYIEYSNGYEGERSSLGSWELDSLKSGNATSVAIAA